MLEKLRGIDLELFVSFQETFQSAWADSIFVLTGNMYFWLPLFAFFGYLLYANSPKRIPQNLFFALATYVISYQAAFLLSYFIHFPAPYVIESLATGIELPGYQNILSFSLPDWGMASFSGLVYYLHKRLPHRRRLLWSLSIPLGLLIAFSRIYIGVAFPFDILFAPVIGITFGFIFSRFLQHWEYVSRSKNTPEPSEQTEKVGKKEEMDKQGGSESEGVEKVDESGEEKEEDVGGIISRVPHHITPQNVSQPVEN